MCVWCQEVDCWLDPSLHEEQLSSSWVVFHQSQIKFDFTVHWESPQSFYRSASVVLGGVCGFTPLAVKHSHVSCRWVTHGIFNLRSILGWMLLGGVCGFTPLAVKHSHVSCRWVTHGIFNLRSILGWMLCTLRQWRRDEPVRLLAQKTGKRPRSCLNWDLNPYRWVFGTYHHYPSGCSCVDSPLTFVFFKLIMYSS